MVSAGVLIYALSCWRQSRMAFFAYTALAVLFNVLGYFLEVTASDLNAAIVACKVTYTGAPLTGVMLFFFSLDYTGRKRIAAPARNTIIGIALLFTVSTFLYPDIPLFYSNLEFSTEGLVNHLVVTPGPLYYPCFAFTFIFTIWAFFNLVVGFIREKRYEGSLVFIFSIALPLLAQVYAIVFGLINGWSPVRAALAFGILLLAIFLSRYRQAEWQSIGREQVVQEMQDAFILIDNKGMVLDYNLSAAGYFPALGSKTGKVTLSELWDFPVVNYTHYGTYQTDFDKNGRILNLKVTTAPLDANGKVTGTCVTINDDTVNHLMMQELSRLARRDDLTGLNNRATFFQDATTSFDLAVRQGELTGCAMMMDIDFFKDVNDTYGHAVGDEVLRFMGKLLIKRLRHTDIIGRYGGEELVVWMPATSLEGAKRVAEEIRVAVQEEHFEVGSARFNVTISIGIVDMASVELRDFEDLIKKADLALYEAKNTGRNRVCVYNEKPGGC
jgi:diguanylate cyclase (GGDEF)-like protein